MAYCKCANVACIRARSHLIGGPTPEPCVSSGNASGTYGVLEAAKALL